MRFQDLDNQYNVDGLVPGVNVWDGESLISPFHTLVL